MPELDVSIYQRILKISQSADSKLEAGSCKEAIQLYNEAMKLLPKPIEQWEAATWLSGSAGNALYMDRQYRAAVIELRRTLKFPGATSNPFILLRLGQSLFELGDQDEARNELVKAYMLGGNRIFDDEHPKYFRLIKTLI